MDGKTPQESALEMFGALCMAIVVLDDRAAARGPEDAIYAPESAVLRRLAKSLRALTAAATVLHEIERVA